MVEPVALIINLRKTFIRSPDIDAKKDETLALIKRLARISLMIEIKSKRRWAILLGSWILVSLFLSGVLFLPGFQSRFPYLSNLLVSTDLQLQDRLISSLEPLSADEDIIFLAIDESSMSVAGDDPEIIAESRALTLLAEGWPFSREVWALTIDRLLQAGAKVVIIDLMLDSAKEGDGPLREMVIRYPEQIVLASSLVPPANSQGISGLATYTEPAESILPDSHLEQVAVGFVNFWPDLDGKVRRIRFQETREAVANSPDHPQSPVFPSLTTATLEALGDAPAITRERGSFAVPMVRNLPVAYAPKPLYEIFWPSLWERNYQEGEIFRDKIVMIGPSAAVFQDLHPTSIGTVLGPQLHLNAITATRQEALFRALDRRTDIAILALLGLLALLVVGLIRRPLIAIGGLVLLLVAFLGSARLGLEAGTTAGLIGPMLAMLGVGTTGILYDYSRVFRERLLLRRALEKRVSGDVLKEILENPGSYLNQLGGVRKTVTILFSDLRGFTKMSESAVPEEMVARLNAYFDLMVGRIQDERGMVDKFIGDAIMAVWGSVPSQPEGDTSAQATRAALLMCRELERLNRRWMELAENEDAPAVQWAMGIGLHCGDAITGNIGSEKRLELTVIGDAVNLASRLEGVTKPYGVPIIVSEAVADHLLSQPGWILRPLDRVRVVGRRQPVSLFQPLAAPDLAADPESPLKALQESAPDFSAAFETYLQADFANATKCYQALAEQFPEDIPTRKLLERSRQFQKEPPGDDWDGGITLDSK